MHFLLGKNFLWEGENERLNLELLKNVFIVGQPGFSTFALIFLVQTSKLRS